MILRSIIYTNSTIVNEVLTESATGMLLRLNSWLLYDSKTIQCIQLFKY